MEVVVEFSHNLEDQFHASSRSHKIGYSEMISALSLSEATSRYSHDTSLFKHLHAVQEVRLLF